MLAIVPEPHLSQWKEKIGIDDASLATLPVPSEKKVDLGKGAGKQDTEAVKGDDNAPKVSEDTNEPVPMDVDK